MKAKIIGGALLALTLAACDGGETSNPATVKKDELNPPGNLVTLTGDSEITLWFTNGNAEENFKGYYVFAAKKKLADLAGSALKYPTGVNVSKGGQFPRCKDNSAFFVQFGFKASESDCDGADEPATPAKTGSTLMADEPAKAEVLDNWVKCSESAADAKLSLVKKPKTDMGATKCTIKEAWSGTAKEAIKNGEVITIFVAAVAEDDFSKVSWSSNFVEDAASKTARLATEPLTVPADKFLALKFNSSSFDAVTVDAAATCPGNLTAPTADQASKDAHKAGPCAVTGTNATATNAIFIARDARSLSHPERLFISTSNSSEFEIEMVNNSADARMPGDEPSTDHTYAGKGTKILVLDNSIFDFKWTTGGNTRFGKIAIGNIEYASDNESDATVPVTIIMQPGAGVAHYMTESQDD